MVITVQHLTLAFCLTHWCSCLHALDCGPFVNVSFLLSLKVFLAMMAPQQMQHLLSPNQLQALIHQKQQALMLQQVFMQ